MTLAVYPLVYLPVAASFRNADPGQEEVARSLGAGRLATFWRVTLGQARGAILGGCLLVALVMLAEYGAFEILGYQTFTTEIFTEFSVSFNIPTACALSLVLVVLSLLVLCGEAARRAAAAASAAPARSRSGSRTATGSGRATPAVLARLRAARRARPSACRSAQRSTGCSSAGRALSDRRLAARRGLAHRPLQRPAPPRSRR